jgi:hypothetical protein
MTATVVSPDERDLRKLIVAVNELGRGRSNAVGTLTLATSTTTTVVVAQNCGATSQVFLDPRTSNAAAARGTTYIQAADIKNGQFTVTHASNGQTDRTFGYICLG